MPQIDGHSRPTCVFRGPMNHSTRADRVNSRLYRFRVTFCTGGSSVVMEYPLHRHLFRRAPVSAALATLLLAGLMPSFALGAPIPARATLLPVRQFVGDSTGRLLTFRVR